MIKKILAGFILLFIIGCSQKSSLTNASNLTANAIHSKIYKAVQDNNLDDADNLFLSLDAQYPSSIYIKPDLLILFLAHMQNEEYKLAKFYIGEYEKRFAGIEEIPWCEYQKIKADFFDYQNAYTDQGKLLNLIEKCKHFKENFSSSKYIYEVNTIHAKALLTKKYLDDKIYKLYKKLDKPKAAKQYKTAIPKNSKEPVVPWYKKIFYW